MLTVARWTQPDYVERARSSGRAQLLTIPYSHYVELARWTLELAGRPYEEQWFMPGQHVLPLLSLRVAHSSGQLHLSSSSFVAKAGRPVDTYGHKAAAKARSTAVPALCTPDGAVLSDSWAIAAHAAACTGSGTDTGRVLLPLSDESLLHMYDTELGPLARQFAYGFFLQAKNRPYWDGLLCHEQVEDSALVSGCEAKLDALFDRIARERLPPPDSGHRFINGDTMGVEDVALAALAAPVVVPPGYCAGRYTSYFAALEASDDAARGKMNKFRATPVGQWVLAFYADFR